jgi:hypothetical protein
MVDDVGERAQWDRELDGEHELAEDLACTWCDQRRPNQYAALAVRHSFSAPL